MKRHTSSSLPLGSANFLSILEGIEGGFAVFVGIVIGLYFQNVSHDLLVVTGLIGIIVSAFNSSAVRYTSEHYLDELDGHEKRTPVKSYLFPALIEFATYAFVSLIAVLPLIFLRNTLLAISLSVLLTIGILFCAGSYKGSLLGRHAIRDGIEMSLLGVAIILAGAVSGWIIALLVAR